MKIKIIPSKMFNQALDKWLDKSMDNEFGIRNNDCDYCSFFRCEECILWTKNNCCGGLYNKYWNANERGKAKKIADKIVDFIIDRCVYGVPE